MNKFSFCFFEDSLEIFKKFSLVFIDSFDIDRFHFLVVVSTTENPTCIVFAHAVLFDHGLMS